MPIKLTKGFGRRKSSGNVLDEVENPPQPSFRVLERTSSDSKVLDTNGLLKGGTSGLPPPSPTADPDNIFAGTGRPSLPIRSSGGTDRPAVTTRMYSSSSSTRFSSSSTLPSSADGPAHEDSSSPVQRELSDVPVPAFAGVPRAAGRTFSFGGKFVKNSTPPSPVPEHAAFNSVRTRGMTASTSSTATPPRILDTDLGFGTLGDDLSKMFDNFGKRSSAVLLASTHEDGRATDVSLTTSMPNVRADKGTRLAPVNTDRSQTVEPSLQSSDSRTSADKLLGPELIPLSQTSLPASMSMPVGERRKSLPSSNSMPLATTSHRSLERPVETGKGLRRSIYQGGGAALTAVEDEDAKLVMKSLYESNKAVFPNDPGAASLDTPASTLSPGASEIPVQSQIQSDPSIESYARLAARFEELPSGPSNKVMTPAQFERYRQQQELRRSNGDASKSEDSEDSEYEDDDEAEKNREAEIQRRKQEAHLSVYRQQMMKVTGQRSPEPSLRPETSPRPEIDLASKSSPNLSMHLSPRANPVNQSGSGKSSEADDDEEIPLGILAAHGFPNRNRPPARLASMSSNPNLCASVQPYTPSPGSPSADRDVTPRTSLPVFARNLPRDPYLGASLVTPANRESLAFGAGASTRRGASPTPPPGGLVGVIANEERARAMRRTSPNPQSGFDIRASMPGLASIPGPIPRPYTMVNMNNVSDVSQPSQAVSPSEHASIQLSQQMSHMMQMQMQFLQQMMQMQGMPTPPPTNRTSYLAPPMLVNPNQRPLSIPPKDPSTGLPPQIDPRALSMLDPNMVARWSGQPMPPIPGCFNQPGTLGGQGYAPSIAPSERSNVGMASRYRPVSSVPPDQTQTKRTSSFVSLAPLKPLDNNYCQSTISLVLPNGPQMAKSHSMTTVTVRPVLNEANDRHDAKGSNNANSDDDNDEEAWAEMREKREKKKSGWKFRKATSSFSDLLSAAH